MVHITDITDNAELLEIFSIIRTIVIVVVLLFVFNFIVRRIEKALLGKVHTRVQMHNVKIFLQILGYLFFTIIVITAISAYVGSWTGIGLGIGFLSAALGWALQKPITGIAAWLMIILQKPFRIGDRVNIGGVRGDVADIKLTHIYLDEIGGIVPGEENSGRLILIPNSILFDQNVTNYNRQDEYMLDQVSFTITFESNLEKAKAISLQATKDIIKEIIERTREDPYIRTFFSANGMNINVRYSSPATRLQEYSSMITEEIYKRLRKEADIELAYPHTKVKMGRDDRIL